MSKEIHVSDVIRARTKQGLLGQHHLLPHCQALARHVAKTEHYYCGVRESGRRPSTSSISCSRPTALMPASTVLVRTASAVYCTAYALTGTGSMQRALPINVAVGSDSGSGKIDEGCCSDVEDYASRCTTYDHVSYYTLHASPTSAESRRPVDVTAHEGYDTLPQSEKAVRTTTSPPCTSLAHCLTPANSPGWHTAHPPRSPASQSSPTPHRTPYPSPPPQTQSTPRPPDPARL